MQINKFNTSLFDWYHQTKRDLPFRGIDDPYKIWLSEVMLQQTQVATVIPYFKRWVQSFPTLESVAKADQEHVLKYWEGLGYYSRCRNFHKAAKIVVESFDGIVPDNYDEFRSLPGVGDYTAAAVLSIAFGQPLPVIDGNVKRVMSRVLGLKHLRKHNLSRIQSRLKLEISPQKPGDFNQAMMELGARVCSPKNPGCGSCPISFTCKAFQLGSPESYPAQIKKSPIPHYEIVAGLIWRNDSFYIQKRQEGGMLAGLWEFPGGKVEKDESLENALLRELKEECGASPKILKKIGTIKHAYTHFKITFHGFHCTENGMPIHGNQQSKWIKPTDIEAHPFPKANHKLFSILNEQGWHV